MRGLENSIVPSNKQDIKQFGSLYVCPTQKIMSYYSCVYMNDIVVIGMTNRHCGTQQYLGNGIDIKEQGDLKYLLGIEFSQSSKDIFFSTKKYAFDLLHAPGNLGPKPTDTPAAPLDD